VGGCSEATESRLARLRLLAEADRAPPARPQPPEGFDSWAEFYEWERSSDRPAKR